MEKIPVESAPWTIGVLKTSQVCPRSGEWKTRATEPPVANQRLWSGTVSVCRLASREGAEFLKGSRGDVVAAAGAEAPLFHGLLGPDTGTTARQLLLAANAPSPSTAGGSCAGGIDCQVWPSSVVRSSNFSFPVSSGTGSPSATPWVRSKKIIESKKPLGFSFLNWSCQCWPASTVW